MRRRELLLAGGALTTGALVGGGGLARATGGAAELGAEGPERKGLRMRRVTFRSADGTRLVGDLRTPAGRHRGARAAVIVPTTMTGARDQSVVTRYASGLARAGYVTLAFDQRRFGESGGRPRRHEDIEERMVDLSAAVTFLRGLEGLVDPDRIGGLGVSIAAGLLLRLTAFDPRVRAFVGIAGGFSAPHAIRANLGADAYSAELARMASARERFDRTGRLEYIPIVTPNGQGGLFPAPDAFEYYGVQPDGTWRGRSRTWRNRASSLSLRTLLIHDVRTMADLVGDRAGLLIVGEKDRSTPVVDHQHVYERLSGPRRLIVLPGVRHNDLYDREPHVSTAVREAADWFGEQLG